MHGANRQIANIENSKHLCTKEDVTNPAKPALNYPSTGSGYKRALSLSKGKLPFNRLRVHLYSLENLACQPSAQARQGKLYWKDDGFLY
jgi:hypothetical protein